MAWLKTLFLREPNRKSSPLAVALNALLAVLVLAALCLFSLSQLTTLRGWSAIWKYRELFAQGWLLAIALSASALLLSLLLGVALALARRSRILALHFASRAWVELIRSTPLLVQILLFYYGVFNQVGLENRFVAGVLILSIFESAYISEIVRAGIENVPQTQWESARAIGFTPPQIYRYVVFPQALRASLPPLAGQFVSLVKDSSLLSVIGISELTQNAQNVASYTFSSLESYIPLAIGYLILTLPISLWTQSLERSHHFET